VGNIGFFEAFRQLLFELLVVLTVCRKCALATLE
jgi:hypothetical protein